MAADDRVGMLLATGVDPMTQDVQVGEAEMIDDWATALAIIATLILDRSETSTMAVDASGL